MGGGRREPEQRRTAGRQATGRTARETHSAMSTPSQNGLPPPIDDLRHFAHFARWTVADFARLWSECTAGQARRALQRLQGFGVVACLQGPIYGRATADHPGGRGPDLYYLTPHGAAVLEIELSLAHHTLKAPTIALDRGRVTAGGRRKAQRAAVMAWDPHQCAIQQLALHLGCFDGDWLIQRQLPYVVEVDRERRRILPDLAHLDGHEWYCLEVEHRSRQWAHIREKYLKYSALAALLDQLNPAMSVTLVLVFADPATRRLCWPRHERGYALHGAGLRLYTIDLAAALAGAAGDFWRSLEFVDRQALRRRLRELHERLADSYRGW